MTSPYRDKKLNTILREELSQIFLREVEFPENGMITITRVSISPDRRYAAVFLSIIAKNVKTILDILEEKVYYIQQLLNRRLQVRPVPKIRFALDGGEIKRQRIEKSLSALRKKENI